MVTTVTCSSVSDLLARLQKHRSRPQHVEGRYHSQRDHTSHYLEVSFSEPLIPSIRVFGFKLRTPNGSPRIVKAQWRVRDTQLIEAPEGTLDELHELVDPRRSG